MAGLPSLYEYYTGGGINSGLSADHSYFNLNGKNITLYSGAMHYFRVPPQYWRDRLRKMRAAGLNTVETYVPWNLHEPEIGNFDFGQNGSDMEQFLDIATFLKTAQEEDLLAIVRPGPYICSEWDFGGLPSWLLREKDIKVRTSQESFMKHVTRYFNVLLPLLATLQFSLGGPIIAFQVENEYGSTSESGVFVPDKVYLEQLRQLNIKNGIVELLFTSDSPTGSGTSGTLPEYFLQTANFASNPEYEFDYLNELQPNKPTMAMEFWTGWFDHWTEEHNTRNNLDFHNVLERILNYPASVNMYMFHGGTNWGFLNGANLAWGTLNEAIQHDTTSYDYDAPLSEAGDYTEKYEIVKELIYRYNQIPTKLPPQPPISEKIAYQCIPVEQHMKFNDVIERIPERFEFSKPIAMEQLPINNDSGQSYGYIIYKKSLNIPANSILQIEGHVCDTVMVLIDGVLISNILTGSGVLDGFGYWRIDSGTLNLGSEDRTNVTLELITENWGRNNFGKIAQFNQLKGLWQGDVLLNGEILSNWQTIPLQFKSKWTNNLFGWYGIPDLEKPGPALYRAFLDVQNPKDTFIDMRKWTKGIVVINGFVLGRYAATIGPQQTLYLPAPLLKNGINEIIVFEHFVASSEIVFSSVPIFYTPKSLKKIH